LELQWAVVRWAALVLQQRAAVWLAALALRKVVR
jgi:hypothetical protein